MSEVDEHTLPQGLLRHFDLTATTIITRREDYPGGLLFFDRLLSLAGIDGPSLYPPTSPVGYRRLLHAIHSSPLDRLKKDCFYYYLLKSVGSGGNDNEPGERRNVGTRSRVFAESRCLSKTWRVFMDGYWALDHGLWEESITNLTNPLITELNFPSEIIYTLSTLAPSSTALTLIHRFLLTRLPDSSTPETDLNLYTISLASSQSISAAFSFIRTLPIDQQDKSRDGIWSWAFGAPKFPVGHGTVTKSGCSVNQNAIKEILHLPLLPHEDDQLLSFLLSPPRNISPESMSLLHDLVTLRLIHQGKYAESLQLDKELAGTGGSEISRQRRREMVREFIAILPEAQRRVLAVDGEFIASKRERDRANGEGFMEIDMTPKESTPAFPLEPLQPPTPIPEAPAIPQSRVTSISSPFSGPPRFAPTSNNPNSPQISRVLSGSPFTLPMSKGANAIRSASSSGMRTPTMASKELPIPRPKARPVVRDEDEVVERPVSKSRKRVRDDDDDVDMDQDRDQGKEKGVPQSQEGGRNQEKEKEEVVEPIPEIEVDMSEDTHEIQPEKEKTPTPPAPTPRTRRTKPPPPSPTPRKSTRQSIPPPSPLHARIPGSFDLSIPQSVPEDQSLQTRTSRKTKPKPKEELQPRSRMTRSVSRAISLDLDASSPPPPPPPPGRSVRSRRGSTAASEVTERASPTPSTRSRRAGSQTPRKSTRVKK